MHEKAGGYNLHCVLNTLPHHKNEMAHRAKQEIILPRVQRLLLSKCKQLRAWKKSQGQCPWGSSKVWDYMTCTWLPA